MSTAIFFRPASASISLRAISRIPTSTNATTRIAILHQHLRTMASTRQASPEEQTIIDEVLSLYQLKPTDKSYSHYSQTAVFHDPVSIAQGLNSIKSQFNGMPKIFSSSTTKQCDVLDAPSTTNSIILNLTQHYVFKGSVMPEKTMNSKITLQRNSQGLIEHHEEEWDHQPNKTGEDGFVGKLQELRKKATAKMVQAGVSSDPSKV